MEQKNRATLLIRFTAIVFILLNPFINSLSGNEYKAFVEAGERLTLLVNKDGIVPVDDLDRGRFALVAIGNTTIFESRIRDYLEMPVIRIDPGSAGSVAAGIARLAEFNRIIAAIVPYPGPEDGSDPAVYRSLIDSLQIRETIAVWFGSPADLPLLNGFENFGGLLVGYGTGEYEQDQAAQLLFGATGASATLTEDAGSLFPRGWGLSTSGGLRLRYSMPQEIGTGGTELGNRIDSIVNAGLMAGAFPGCRVLVAVEGSIIIDRAWGFHTYDGRVRTRKDDLYDLASVTKIAGPLPLYMKLDGQGALDLEKPLSYYWDDWRNRLFRRSNKNDLTLIDLLTHQSGITPYINYWQHTMRNGRYIRRWYRHQYSESYPAEIGEHLYLRDNFKSRVYRDIRISGLASHGEYRYSCLPFIVSPRVLENIDGREYTAALYEDFYLPLGASTLRYNPRQHVELHRIVPTETDRNFRQTLVHGYVHDEAAAVLGGISGNAGLFSTAGDLAKLLQMYLNGGEYGGRRYLLKETIDRYSTVQFPENGNRRGIGFDKPLLDNQIVAPVRAYPCPGASPSSYGHSGFTGTFVWIDPEFGILYIFLSNRVHPTRDNNLISSMNIRTDILQAVYDALNGD